MSSEKYPRSSIEDDFNYGTNVATASVQIRMDFLRKVYTLLSLQIILTTATSALFMFSQTIKDFVHGRLLSLLVFIVIGLQPGPLSFLDFTVTGLIASLSGILPLCSCPACIWVHLKWNCNITGLAYPAIVLVSALLSLVLLLALAMYRHQHPVNLYLLLIFTLLEAVSVATALTFYEYSTIFQALVLTCAVFAGLTAYTFQSKRDLSKMGAGLFACLWILIIASFMRFFFNSDSTDVVLAGAGALIFCGFIIYDTHLLMKQLSPEEHILASINLYLDIVNLFLHILRVLDSMKKH